MTDYVQFIPPDARCVVEFGCGDGSAGKAFKKIQPACRYIGIDTDEVLLNQAAGELDQTARESFSSMDLQRHGIVSVDCFVYQCRFLSRAILKQKIMEHMAFLSEGGQLLFCLDNIGYFHNVLSLWQGKPPLTETTMTDNELLAILQECGLCIDRVVPRYAKEDAEVKKLPPVQKLIESFVSYCQARRQEVHTDLWARGFIIRAVKLKQAPPRLLVQTLIGETAACARVRIYEPHAFCRTIFGMDSDDRPNCASLDLGKAYKEKLLLRQRMILRTEQDLEQLAMVVKQDYAIMYEIDDSPFLWKQVYEKMAFADFICCHAIQVSTPALADVMRQFNPHVVVFKNQLAYLPERRKYAQDQSRVTLFFGALNRGEDWQDIMPVLNEALHKYGDKLQVKVIFDKAFYDALQTVHKELIGQQFFKGFVPYDIYAQALHSSDISLLPLRDTEFNRMKSDLKFIESAGHGAVVLASPTVYETSVRNGRTGFIYHTVKEFRDILFMLIEQRERRIETAEAAYAYVRHERLLSQHYREREAFYRELTVRAPEMKSEVLACFTRIQDKIRAARQ